jgi:hypothetical protein
MSSDVTSRSNWGEGQKHVERQSTQRSRGIELLGDRDERDAVCIEGFDQIVKIG